MMKAPYCPTCGRRMPCARPPHTERAEHSTSDMTKRELYAYYKRTAPASDLAFTRRNASPELQAAIDTIEKPTPADAARVRERRRIELAEAERAAGPSDWIIRSYHPNCQSLIALERAFYEGLAFATERRRAVESERAA